MENKGKKRSPLGQRIELRLQEIGKDLSGLAKHMGVSQPAASQWLTGKTNPKNIHTVAEYLQTSVEWLKTGEGAKELVSAPAQKVMSIEEEMAAFSLTIFNACKSLSPEAKDRLNIDGIIATMKTYFSKQTPSDERKKNLPSPMHSTGR
jgi:transcriptional regulator with XRE-family HTH domain